MNNSKITTLKNWLIATDKDNIGKKNNYHNNIVNGAISCVVPSIIQQYFPNYHGVCWYYCKFKPEISVTKTDRIILNFGGVDYKAEVWLNGEYLGSEEGGETPFSFDVTNLVDFSRENLIAVRVVNPTENVIDGITYKCIPHRNKEIFKQAGSNLNHGGIWYDVKLYSVPAVYIEDKTLTGSINGDFTASIDFISHLSDVDGEITVKITENNSLSLTVAEKTVNYTFVNGDNNVTLNLSVPNVILWDSLNPYLYIVEITVDTKYGKQSSVNKFGFREFKVENGYFYLNGKKTFLKCAHTGNAYPVGQMYAVHIEQMRQDLIYAKASGFNTLRAISGVFRPEQIALADEIGLLLYEECFASWCMGYSNAKSWKDSNEFKKVQEKYSVEIGSEEDMSKRWIHATENMIKRDKNATNIIAWGLLNETFESSISKTAIAFLPLLRKIDKSRLVVLSSGRWEKDFTVGSVSNPYSNNWDNAWGNDGVLESIEKPNENDVGDVHYYPVAPISDDAANKIRTLGHNTKYPVFFSEFGVGAQFNVIEEYRHFVQYGERPDLEDGEWVELQSNQFISDFNRLNLGKVYPFPESFLKDSQRINADERKRHFDMIRSNNRICGYSLTGLLDHGMCGEGLWSYWRRWKPEMFDAVSDGWEKVRFCNFVTINSYNGNEVILESVLANDGVLKSGTYTANFAVYNENGVYLSFSEKFYLDGNDFATCIFKRKVNLNLKEGKYFFSAELNEGSPAGTTTHFYVYDKVDVSKLKDFSVYGLSDEEKQGVTNLGLSFNQTNSENLILVGNNLVDVNEIINLVLNGKTVILLDSKLYSEENIEKLKVVVDDFKITNHRDWLYHKEYMLADNDVFNGLGSRILELARFQKEFPHTAIKTDKTPNYVISPAFLTGFYGAKTGYELNYGLLGFNYGKGKIIFNTFDILSNLGSPVADKLLVNLIKKFNN